MIWKKNEIKNQFGEVFIELYWQTESEIYLESFFNFNKSFGKHYSYLWACYGNVIRNADPYEKLGSRERKKNGRNYIYERSCYVWNTVRNN